MPRFLLSGKSAIRSRLDVGLLMNRAFSAPDYFFRGRSQGCALGWYERRRWRRAVRRPGGYRLPR
jgi:hypothetical protein